MVPGDELGRGRGIWYPSFVCRDVIGVCFHLLVYTMLELIPDMNSCIVASPLKERTWKSQEAILLYYNHLESFGGQNFVVFSPWCCRRLLCWMHWYQWYSCCFLYSHWCACVIFIHTFLLFLTILFQMYH
jgi:hypothetical protein